MFSNLLMNENLIDELMTWFERWMPTPIIYYQLSYVLLMNEKQWQGYLLHWDSLGMVSVALHLPGCSSAGQGYSQGTLHGTVFSHPCQTQTGSQLWIPKRSSRHSRVHPDYLWKWIDLIYHRVPFFIQPSARDWIYGIIPPKFKAKFPRLTNIIDCFEIFIEVPSNKARAQTWSDYKAILPWNT